MTMEKTGKILVVDNTGKTVKEQAVPVDLQQVKVKQALLHQVIVAYEANKRAGTAHTKTRDEVAGGGRKPWQQKGTGRARHGSIRSPLWVGGGVTFGPRSNRNYSQKLNKQVKDKALQMAVADRIKSGDVLICQSYPDSLKTKDFAKWLKSLPGQAKKMLVILSEEEKQAARGMKNISNINIIAFKNINPYDLLKFKNWLISEKVFNNLVQKVVSK